MATLNLSITDWQQSVLGSMGHSRAYSPYGVPTTVSGPRLAYCGELRDPVTGVYHLGNGHRSYDPGLMRFHSPDRLSPFGAGGLNAYAYCKGDPVNYRDPTGRLGWENLVHGAAMTQLTKFDKNMKVAVNVLRTQRRLAKADDLMAQGRRPISSDHQPPEGFSNYEVAKALASPVTDALNAGASITGLLISEGHPASTAVSAVTGFIDGWTNNWSAENAERASRQAADARDFLNTFEDVEASGGGQPNRPSMTPPPAQIFTVQNEITRNRRGSEASEISN